MTDRPPVQNGDSGVDAELERRLRAAFGGAAVPEAPDAVHAEVARLAVMPDVRVRSILGRWPAPGWIAVVLALSAILIGSLFSGGSSPAPAEPSRPAESTEASQPAPSSRTSAACDVSPGAIHGVWWREIGGPNAYFNWVGGPLPGPGRWQSFVRFDPDAGSVGELSVWADRLGSDERAVGSFNSGVDPSAIFRAKQLAPELPGGLYLFQQPLPTPGCWRVSAAIRDRVVGTAVIEVAAAVPPHPSPTISPTPELEPTPLPVESMAPAADDVLPLAGRDGLPGSLYCGLYMPFALDALHGPTGAEDGVGPEFDVLRSTAGGDPDPGGDYGPDPTFREVAREATAVLFLYEVPGRTGEGFRYLYIVVERDGIDWRWAGSGDCSPRAVAPPGYGQATWTLDPAFRAPGGETRTLHILVNQLECSSGQSASGRISPAFVTWDERELLIEIFVQSIPGGGDCQGVPPTPATLRLPVPVGGRTLVDPATQDQGGTGG